MSIINKNDLKYYEDNSNFVKYNNKTALFFTKLASDIRHNNEVVDVLGVVKGRDEDHDSYIVKFNDDTIENNIMNIELQFDYIRDNVQIETRKTLSKIMRKYELTNKEAEELYNASLNYDYEANEGTVFTTVESIERLFTEENSEETVNPSEKQMKAMAEYIKKTRTYYMLYGYEEFTQKVIDMILIKDTNNDITKLELLNEIKDMISHNIMCYSSDCSLGKAKEGFENELKKENKKLLLVEEMIKETEQQENKKKLKNKEVR